eukprot:Pgem_evm1s17260
MQGGNKNKIQEIFFGEEPGEPGEKTGNIPVNSTGKTKKIWEAQDKDTGKPQDK